MPKYAANITHLFDNLPFLTRFDAAAAAGFQGVEILFPYDQPVKEIQQALALNGLKNVLINAPPPNYTGGTQGFPAVAGCEERFRSDMRRVFRYTKALGTSVLHVMSGNAAGEGAKELFIENLHWACANAPKGLMLSIEPLNPVSFPGYFLNCYDLAADIIRTVGAGNLCLQYDSFHAQMITGDAVACFRKHQHLIKHIQIADSPKRSAPGSGEVDFKSLFREIDASGYKGWISAEYAAGANTVKTLKWMKRQS